MGFDDVVLDERVLCPAVDGEVTGAGRLVCAAISNLTRYPQLARYVPFSEGTDKEYVPRAAGVPSFAAHETAVTGPVDCEVAPIAVVTVEAPTALRPVGPEVTSELPGAYEVIGLREGLGIRDRLRCGEHTREERENGENKGGQHCDLCVRWSNSRGGILDDLLLVTYTFIFSPIYESGP